MVGSAWRAQGRGAATALVLAVWICAAAAAFAEAPAGWLEADRLGEGLAHSGPLAILWPVLASALPFGELAVRYDALARILVVANATALTLAAFQLFRGPGRVLAAVSAGVVGCLALLSWSRGEPPGAALDGLTLSLLVTLAVAALLRSLVHFGHVTALARSRAFAGAAAAAVVSPRAGVPLLVLIAAAAWLRRGKAESTTKAWARSIATGLLPSVLAAGALGFAGASWPSPDVTGLSLAVPDLDPLSAHLSAVGVYSGLVLLVVIVLPLRWRGGVTVAMLGVAGLTIVDSSGPFSPTPAMLMLLAGASAGWVWLAGTITKRRRLGLAASFAAAFTLTPVLFPTVERWSVATLEVAHQRTQASLLRLMDKGLVAPGDAVIVHDPWLARSFEERARLDGWRPDVLTLAVDQADPSHVLQATIAWEAQGRRVLSDSFDAGGNWSPRWVLDSGPLFWFVGEQAPIERDFTDLSRFEPSLEDVGGEESARWAALALERTRYRRALDEPSQALDALPMTRDRRRSLQTRLALARSVVAHAGADSELTYGPPTPAQAQAALVAEAGDLLYAQGERERASELLAESAAGGFGPAAGALARWQLRAGEQRAARQTQDALASTPRLRPQVVELIYWLLARDRTADAARLARSVGGPTEVAAAEIGARLRLQGARASIPPGHDSAPPDLSAFSKRLTPLPVPP